jgi:hypothetical protein
VSVNLLAVLRRELRIEPWQHGRIRELEEYLFAKGPEALRRQIELGKTRHRCCWNHIDEGHHGACPVGRKAA